MSQKINIVFLYREIMPYNIPVLIELVKLNSEIIFIHDNTKKLTPYLPPYIEGVKYYKKSDLNRKSLGNLVNSFNPNILYISDRTIPIYNKIGIIYNGKIPVISGNDTPWYGGKQWFNIITSKFRHKRFFSHMQVAGMRQFEYAKKLGFANDKIIFPLLSADVSLFLGLEVTPKRFEKANDVLFVGRFNKVKGIEYLIEGWNNVKNKRGGLLHLVGNGDLIEKIDIPKDVIIHPFSNQEYLSNLALKCKAFILPSIFEPWGVVVHEFAAAGLPLIVSDVCGSSPHLLINNFNGYTIKPYSAEDIKNAITKIYNLDSMSIYEMGKNSRFLSKSITPELVASAILSTLK